MTYRLKKENVEKIGFVWKVLSCIFFDNLVEWTDHGIILTQHDVPWVDAASYSMWAPDCIDRNGKYYFFFPSQAKGRKCEKGFGNWGCYFGKTLWPLHS
jgi:hypothetical protein